MFNISRKLLSAAASRSFAPARTIISGPPKNPFTSADQALGISWCVLICIPPAISVFLLPSWRDKDKNQTKEESE